MFEALTLLFSWLPDELQQLVFAFVIIFFAALLFRLIKGLISLLPFV